MTERLEGAIAKLRTLPADRQDEAARILLRWVDGPPAVQLTTEQAQEVTRRLDLPTPRCADHAEVAAFFGHERMG